MKAAGLAVFLLLAVCAPATVPVLALVSEIGGFSSSGIR